MQKPENQIVAIKTPYQTPKLEFHDVWQIATGVTLSIGENFVPSELEVEL
jgi:hypothetical protein